MCSRKPVGPDIRAFSKCNQNFPQAMKWNDVANDAGKVAENSRFLQSGLPCCPPAVHLPNAIPRVSRRLPEGLDNHHSPLVELEQARCLRKHRTLSLRNYCPHDGKWESKGLSIRKALTCKDVDKIGWNEAKNLNAAKASSAYFPWLTTLSPPFSRASIST